MTEKQNQQLALFEKGAEIEVQPDDDEGFGESWYEATIRSIIHTPENPNISFHYEVEYKTLLTEDKTSLLKEVVRMDFVRPLPPQQPHPEDFRLDDVVEVFHKEGRWVGVITKVIQNTKKDNNKNNLLFEVTFTKPPDRRHFRASKLRLHLDWIDGKWVGPKKGFMKRKGSPASSTAGDVDTATAAEGLLMVSRSKEMDLLTINQITQLQSKEKSARKKKKKGTPANTEVMVNVNGSNGGKMVIGDLVVKGNSIDSHDENLPFVKTSPFWHQIESMQIFEAIPQRPHFRTLLDAFPETSREGMAFGYMITFSNVVNKVNELRLDDPRSSIEDCLEALAELEHNGFDVKVIRYRLNSLLSKKDEYFVFLDQLKIHESQIMEQNREKEKIVEEFDELDKQIKALLEKRAMAISVRENVESEIACIESKLESVNQDINHNNFNFKQLAGAPW